MLSPYSKPWRCIISTLNPIGRSTRIERFSRGKCLLSRELPFKKGDTFLVKRRINDDWLEGEHQGVTGIFPLNHVELFPVDIAEETKEPMDQHHRGEDLEGEAIVKHDFIPQKTFELQLRKVSGWPSRHNEHTSTSLQGDRVILLRRLDNNWYEGRLNHVEGIFPASYVETLREPPGKSRFLTLPFIEHH